jgi:hypothetical protein
MASAKNAAPKAAKTAAKPAAKASAKKAVVSKVDMPISELMRRGAFAYAPDESDQELGVLADAAKGAADRAGSAIDDAMAFIAASNKRIASMESNATKSANAAAKKVS